MSRLAAAVLGQPRRILLSAAVLTLAAAALGVPLIGSLQTALSDFEDSGSQTGRSARMIEAATGAQDEVGLIALLRNSAPVRKNKSARAKEQHVAQLLARQPGYKEATNFAEGFNGELLSRDGRESLILATFKTRALAYQAAARLRPQLRSQDVAFGGLDLVFEELTRRSRSDLTNAELLVLPLLIALSLWIFRGVLSALLPLVVGGLSILLTLLCLQGVQQLLSLSIFALNLVTALGMGLAIDYSLFVLSRYREELRAGDPGDDRGRHSREQVRAALRRTLATAGRTVLFSAFTVAAAMAALLFFPLRFLYSMGFAGIFTALLAGATATSVLPAVLLLLGDRIEALSPRWLARRAGGGAVAAQSGGWATLARGVMRRPGAVALLSGVALLAAGSPIFQMGLTPASASLLPTSSQPRQVEERIERNFATNPALPIATVLRASRQEMPRVFEYARALASVSGEPERVHLVRLGGSTWLVSVPPLGDPFSAANERLVRRLRAVHTTYAAAVGGITAWFMDEMSSINSNLPIVALIVALTMFATIFLMTGSVILPLKTLIMNLLTLSVATGVLVVGFQQQAFGPLLNFSGNGGLEPSNLVLLYIVAFALASDYGVFLLARIKEAYDGGLSNREAIALGMASTGRLITAAALLICVAVGALVSSSILSVKELGFGAALAVAVDASVVRALLVPALMALLGDWNWWAPRWLQRVHLRIGLRERAPESAARRAGG